MQMELKHISKSFPGVKVLQDLSLRIEPGKVHAICGENGAGKSTLLNIMSGNLQPDEGSILLDQEELQFRSPKDAFERGISIVYQHLSLVDSLSIAENIFGIHPPVSRRGFLKKRKMILEARELLCRLRLFQAYSYPERVHRSETLLLQVVPLSRSTKFARAPRRSGSCQTRLNAPHESRL